MVSWSFPKCVFSGKKIRPGSWQPSCVGVYEEFIVSMVFAAQETACAAKDHGHASYSHLMFATSKLMLVFEPGSFIGVAARNEGRPMANQLEGL